MLPTKLILTPLSKMNEQRYLIHHGIKGQTWGTRNGPPYPLDSGQKSSAEKYAAKAAKYRTKAEKARKRGEKDWIDRGYKVKAKRLDKKAEKFEEKAAKEKQITAQDVIDKYGDQKTGMLAEIAIATSPIWAVAAIAGITSGIDALASKVYRNKETNKRLEELKFRQKYNSLEEVPKSKTKKEVNDYIKEINPKFKDKKDAGSKMNCVLCTTALVMREKGYKANAQSSIMGFFPKEFFNKTFKGAEYKKIKANNPTKFLDSLSKQGDGAYGHLSVTWKYGGRHSVFYKNEKGKVHIYDGQSGKEIDYKKDSISGVNFFDAIRINESHYIRLDQAETKEKVLGAIR